jgi:hypothetical protein
VVGAALRRRGRGVEDLLDQVVGELVVALGDGEQSRTGGFGTAARHHVCG